MGNKYHLYFTMVTANVQCAEVSGFYGHSSSIGSAPDMTIKKWMKITLLLVFHKK